jgi:hypothetical protein
MHMCKSLEACSGCGLQNVALFLFAFRLGKPGGAERTVRKQRGMQCSNMALRKGEARGAWPFCEVAAWLLQGIVLYADCAGGCGKAGMVTPT